MVENQGLLESPNDLNLTIEENKIKILDEISNYESKYKLIQITFGKKRLLFN
jgi:hypothetical protein